MNVFLKPSPIEGSEYSWARVFRGACHELGKKVIEPGVGIQLAVKVVEVHEDGHLSDFVLPGTKTEAFGNLLDGARVLLSHFWSEHRVDSEDRRESAGQASYRLRAHVAHSIMIRDLENSLGVTLVFSSAAGKWGYTPRTAAARSLLPAAPSTPQAASGAEGCTRATAGVNEGIPLGWSTFWLQQRPYHGVHEVTTIAGSTATVMRWLRTTPYDVSRVFRGKRDGGD
jgi:hypothetical protein